MATHCRPLFLCPVRPAPQELEGSFLKVDGNLSQNTGLRGAGAQAHSDPCGAALAKTCHLGLGFLFWGGGTVMPPMACGVTGWEGFADRCTGARVIVD